MRKKPTNYYSYERKRARLWSGVLHGLYLLLAIFGLPNFLMPTPPVEPVAISVEILPVTGVTNVKPSDTHPLQQSQPEEKQQAQKKPAPPAKPKEPVPAPEPAPVEKRKEKPKPQEEKKPEPKKEEKKKPKEDPFKNLLNDLKNKVDKPQKEQLDKNASKSATSAPAAKSNQYNPTLPMSMSEQDAIISQIAKCWTVPAGAKDAHNLVPVLMAEYNSDGSLLSVGLADEIKSRYNSDSFFRAAVDSAIRATKVCSPLKGLPPEKYEDWRLMEIRFDPKFMLN